MDKGGDFFADGAVPVDGEPPVGLPALKGEAEALGREEVNVNLRYIREGDRPQHLPVPVLTGDLIRGQGVGLGVGAEEEKAEGNRDNHRGPEEEKEWDADGCRPD